MALRAYNTNSNSTNVTQPPREDEPDPSVADAGEASGGAGGAFRRLRRASKAAPKSLFFGPPTPLASSATTTPSPTTANIPINGNKPDPTSPTTPSSSHSIFSLSSIFAKMPTVSSGSSSNAHDRRQSKSVGEEALKGEARVAAIRSAHTIMTTQIKNDWDWEEIQARGEHHAVKRRRKSPPTSNTSSRTKKTKPTTNFTTNTTNDIPSTTEASQEDNTNNNEDDDSEGSSSQASYRSRYESESDTSTTDKSAYRYDNPESVGVKPSREEKKRKRRQDLADEMKWNKGLRCWSERRDCWTGADDNGRVRVGTSLFEDNPLRKYVRPDQYPAIYTKVVLNSRSMPVPVNLQDFTNALVLGWKADDQWPPKPTKPEPIFATRKKVMSSVGESMVKKVFGGFGGR